mmetsp:Transcript_78547/g.234123  ORF Transcript_78547/g.234123 Transcript_78547/m.234123 type:complete len:267 (+) Transcript_78547:1086-1886(+)
MHSCTAFAPRSKIFSTIRSAISGCNCATRLTSCRAELSLSSRLPREPLQVDALPRRRSLPGMAAATRRRWVGAVVEGRELLVLGYSGCGASLPTPGDAAPARGELGGLGGCAGCVTADAASLATSTSTALGSGRQRRLGECSICEPAGTASLPTPANTALEGSEQQGLCGYSDCNAAGATSAEPAVAMASGSCTHMSKGTSAAESLCTTASCACCGGVAAAGPGPSEKVKSCSFSSCARAWSMARTRAAFESRIEETWVLGSKARR